MINNVISLSFSYDALQFMCRSICYDPCYFLQYLWTSLL